MSQNQKYKFDEENGIFVRDSEISVNWLLSQILGRNAQISKVSNADIMLFVTVLAESKLVMPDGRIALYWLREKMQGHYDESKNKLSRVWEDISDQYRFLLEQIDMILAKNNIKDEKIEVEKNIFNINRTPNNLEARFGGNNG